MTPTEEAVTAAARAMSLADEDPIGASFDELTPRWQGVYLRMARAALAAAAPLMQGRPTREDVARAVYNLDPFHESGEYVDGFPVSRGGNLTWEQACARDAEFSGPHSGMLPITKSAFDAADAVLALIPTQGREWRAIETAPKDGTSVWVSNGFSMRVAFWREGKEFEYRGSIGGGWRDLFSAERDAPADLMFTPSYWQDLPKSPAPILADQHAGSE